MVTVLLTLICTGMVNYVNLLIWMHTSAAVKGFNTLVILESTLKSGN